MNDATLMRAFEPFGDLLAVNIRLPFAEPSMAQETNQSSLEVTADLFRYSGQRKETLVDEQSQCRGVPAVRTPHHCNRCGRAY
jgi:hypothetical protein